MTTRERDDEPFLARWSRLKRAGEAKEEALPTASPPPAQAPGPAEARGEVPQQADSDLRPPLELPDPDTLDASADFRVFLREGVPEELKIRALRRLWRVNPIISQVSPLVDYAEDYTDQATVVADLKSVFKDGLRALDRLADLPEPEAEAVADARKAEGAGKSEPEAGAAKEAGKAESST